MTDPTLRRGGSPSSATRFIDELHDQHGSAGLRLQRCCGPRIGELLDLELDCVHEVPQAGSWLKVPQGKLASERMVPIDEDIISLLDHITELRDHGRPLPHPLLPPGPVPVQPRPAAIASVTIWISTFCSSCGYCAVLT